MIMTRGKDDPKELYDIRHKGLSPLVGQAIQKRQVQFQNRYRGGYVADGF